MSGAYLRELKQLGYPSLGVDQTIWLRNHGISAAYIREFNDLGYRGLTPEHLIRVRAHSASR